MKILKKVFIFLSLGTLMSFSTVETNFINNSQSSKISLNSSFTKYKYNDNFNILNLNKEIKNTYNSFSYNKSASIDSHEILSNQQIDLIKGLANNNQNLNPQENGWIRDMCFVAACGIYAERGGGGFWAWLKRFIDLTR